MTALGPGLPVGGAPPLPRAPDRGGGGDAPGERELLAAVDRLSRAPQGWSAVALHLSRLLPPGARPHHRRVARAVMQDAARRGDGKVFDLRGGDVVLLAREAAPPPLGVSEQLRRLFGREAADPAGIVSEWPLPDAGAALLTYVAECLGAPQVGVAAEPGVPPATLVDAAIAAIGGARPSALLQRQTGVLLDLAGGAAGVRMHAHHQELTISLEALEAPGEAPAQLGQDSALLRHLGPVLDQRILQILRDERGRGTPLDIAAGVAIAQHLNLSLPGVLSDEFLALATPGRASRRPLGVEIPLVEAVADLAAFARAGERLRQLGARLVLDGVSHLALLLAHPAALGADLLKLEWSPQMAELPVGERSALVRALTAADPARIILYQADSEAAVRWGLAQRIRMFQGRHIDQMLAVQRMIGCPGAAACTPRQCVERAAVTGGAVRASCTNLPLLDAGLPEATGAARA
jgi:hypothetical protein